MAERYVVRFSKDGYAKYTSHLDLLRFFKRAFRKSGIRLRYSKGFNPHPKLGFAQPLSLGYGSCCELLEFETDECYETGELYDLLKSEMPEGLVLQWCRRMEGETRSLAAICESAEYRVIIPESMSEENLKDHIRRYLAQDEIRAMKRQKKDKKMVSVNIKPMIRRLDGEAWNNAIALEMVLDCGSLSNCSPELVISSFSSFAGIDIPRYEMEVERRKINFYNNLQF